MTTATELLTATDAAILRTLTSQEYHGPGGRRQRMAELNDLRIMRKSLQDEIAEDNPSGSMLSLLSIEGPR